MGTTSFFDDEGMDFAVRCVLTGVRYAMAEVGEILQAVEHTEDGDAQSWVDTWLGLGRRIARLGEACEAAGNRHSAWGAHLRAANYLAAGSFWLPQTPAADTYPVVWHEHRRAWDQAVACWPSAAEAITVDHGGTGLGGWWFPPPGEAGPRPLVVLVNGIDSPASDLVMTGLADGTARGYGVVSIDGPGQGRSFFDQGLALDPDWGPVVAATLDNLADRPQVDTDRVVLMGINHGALLATRAAASLGGRVAALVADPGVVRFDADDLEPVRPTQRPDEPDRFALTDDDLAGVACPTYVAEAEAAMGFVGQPAELADRLRTAGAEVHHDRFTTAEGAGLDCEIGGPQIRNQRVYDWLDDRLRVAST